MFVGQVWDYARWTGDRKFVEEMYDACASYTRLTQAMDTNGNLFPEGVNQPNAGKDGEGVDGAAYLWWALDSMARMAETLEQDDDATCYRKQADTSGYSAI